MPTIRWKDKTVLTPDDDQDRIPITDDTDDSDHYTTATLILGNLLKSGKDLSPVDADKGFYTSSSDTLATFDLTSAGRALIDDADVAAQRTTLGLGGLAILDPTDLESGGSDELEISLSQIPGLAAAYQPLDSDLTALAALTTQAYGRALLEVASEAALKALINLEIGTDVEAYDADISKTDVIETITAQKTFQAPLILGQQTNNLLLNIAGPLLANNATQDQVISGSTGIEPQQAISNFYGLIFLPKLQNSAFDVTSIRALFTRLDSLANYTGLVTNATAIEVGVPSWLSATKPVNLSGLTIQDLTGVGASGFAWGLNILGATMNSRIVGKLKIGSTGLPAEALDIAGNLLLSGILYLGSYTVSTLPSAAVRGLIYVSDDALGATLAYSNGSNWRRVSDGLAVRAETSTADDAIRTLNTNSAFTSGRRIIDIWCKSSSAYIGSYLVGSGVLVALNTPVGITTGATGTTPTGTTGADGNVTIYENSGLIYLENRSGSALTFLCRVR